MRLEAQKHRPFYHDSVISLGRVVALDTFPKCMSAWLSMFRSHFDVSPILSLGKGACALEDVPLGSGCVKFKYSPYPKYTSSSSAHSSVPAQTRSQCHCTLLFAQVRALLNPAPFPLAGQGPKDGGGRREGAVAAVPSPSLDGCLCIPVGVGRARCPGALGAFSQHSQQEGQSFLPQPSVSSVCWQLSQKRRVMPRPALGHPWPDVFGLSGAAKSPSWCSQCLYRQSLSRRKGSSADRAECLMHCPDIP